MSTASKSTHRSSLALNLFEIPLKEDGSEAFTRRQRRSKVTADIDRIFIENSFKSSKEHQQRQRVKHQILEYAAKSVSLSDGDQREDTAHRPDRRSFEDLVAAGALCWTIRHDLIFVKHNTLREESSASVFARGAILEQGRAKL